MTWRIALLCLAIAGCAHAPAGKDVTVLSAGAVEPGLAAALAQFGGETGNRATVSFNTAPQVRERITKGDKFDIVVVPPAEMGALREGGRVGPGTRSLRSRGAGHAARPRAPL